MNRLAKANRETKVKKPKGKKPGGKINKPKGKKPGGKMPKVGKPESKELKPCKILDMPKPCQTMDRVGGQPVNKCLWAFDQLKHDKNLAGWLWEAACPPKACPPFIPKIFWINLNRSTSRRQYMEQQFRELGFTANQHQRIEAVDGADELVTPHPEVSLSEFGCTMSHLKAIRLFLKTDLDYCLIAEDDLSFELLPQWSRNICDLLYSLDWNWQIVNLSPIYDYTVYPSLRLTGYSKAIWSTCCYLINRDYADKVVKLHSNFTKIKRKEDALIDHFLYKCNYSYVFPLFTCNNDFHSEIRHDVRLHVNSSEKIRTVYQTANIGKYLLFSSIGDHSCHQLWLNGDRRFDVVLVYYGDDDAYYQRLDQSLSRQTGVTIYRNQGFKWPNFYHHYLNNDLLDYKYIWVLDDDIEIDTAGINTMYQTLEQYPNVLIAGPSTSSDSDGYWRKIDRHDCKLILQFTNFVECCFPCFNTILFKNQDFIDILAAANTGYYLDYAFKNCLHPSTHTSSMATVHQLMIRHPVRDNNSGMDNYLERERHKDDIDKFVESGIKLDLDVQLYGTIERSETKCNCMQI